MAGRLTMLALGALVGTTAPGTAFAENGVTPTPKCDASAMVNVRYAGTSRRLYLEKLDGKRGGCGTLTSIYTAIRKTTNALIPIFPSNSSESPTITGTWLLSQDLYVLDGITLNVIGGANGDCQELRLLSGAANNTIVNLRAHGGSLNIRYTKVTSWDTQISGPDLDYTSGRSYISAISEMITNKNETCVGLAKNNMGEARMDIVSSEISHLGWYDSESYGLVWKVRGFCDNKSNKELFDQVSVYGNIYDSNIHNNYFGMYSYGHQGGDWRRNKMWGNVQYGFDPHDNSDFLNIHDNEVYDNGNHGIIASVECNGLSIQNNAVYRGKQTGIFLHRSSNNAVVTGNVVYENADAGMAFLETNNAVVRDNVFQRNKYGIRLSVGSADNFFTANKIYGSTEHAIFTYLGSDQPYVAPSGKLNANQFVSNDFWCTDGKQCIMLKEATNTVITSNKIGNLKQMEFTNATGTTFAGNTGFSYQNVSIKVDGTSCFTNKSDSFLTPLC